MFPLLFGLAVLPIIFGTLLVIDRRDLATAQIAGLLMLTWLIPFFGFVATYLYLYVARPRPRV